MVPGKSPSGNTRCATRRPSKPCFLSFNGNGRLQHLIKSVAFGCSIMFQSFREIDHLHIVTYSQMYNYTLSVCVYRIPNCCRCVARRSPQIIRKNPHSRSHGSGSVIVYIYIYHCTCAPSWSKWCPKSGRAVTFGPVWGGENGPSFGAKSSFVFLPAPPSLPPTVLNQVRER